MNFVDKKEGQERGRGGTTEIGSSLINLVKALTREREREKIVVVVKLMTMNLAVVKSVSSTRRG